MNCYEHELEVAVATCKDCGKGLCKACASTYTIPICDNCNSVRGAIEKRNNYLRLIPTIIGFAVGFMIAYQTTTYNQAWTGITYGYLIAGIFWGWKILDSMTPRVFLFLNVAGYLVYFIIKITLSLFIGVIAMPIGIGKILFNLIRVGKGEKDIRTNQERKRT